MKKLMRKFFGKPKPSPTLDKNMIWGITDTGKQRDSNEDAFKIDHENNLFIVADGMGGHKAGEVASQQAIEMISTALGAIPLQSRTDTRINIEQQLYQVLRNSSTKILKMAKENPDYQGMGCTVVVALLEGKTLHTAHVGDARCYICNPKEIVQLGYDHSFVAEAIKEGKMTREEARLSDLKNQITMAIGSPKAIEPEYVKRVLSSGDRVLLCSDGLWDMLSDDNIHQIVMSLNDAKSVCEKLVKAANDAGGHDNITVVVILVP